jgi:hypothetical protein
MMKSTRWIVIICSVMTITCTALSIIFDLGKTLSFSIIAMYSILLIILVITLIMELRNKRRTKTER